MDNDQLPQTPAPLTPSHETYVKKGLHPLIATACVAIIIASLVSVAFITGLFNVHKYPALSSQSIPLSSISSSALQESKSVLHKPYNHNYIPDNVYNDYPNNTQVCINCGVVTSVTSIEQKNRNPIGLGALVGAAGGGLLGNQFGHGNGRTLSTVAGAVGGGYLGNQVENNMSHVEYYRTTVRFENGIYRSFDFKTPQFRVGENVRQAGNSIVMR